MLPTRRARLASLIQDELALVIRTLKDPRVLPLTVTAVEVTQDGSQATVFISLLGSTTGDPEAIDRQTKECLEGLESASGFMKRHLAKILTVRHIPSLIFKQDRGLENSLRVHDLLKQLEGERKESGKTSNAS